MRTVQRKAVEAFLKKEKKTRWRFVALIGCISTNCSQMLFGLFLLITPLQTQFQLVFQRIYIKSHLDKFHSSQTAIA